VSLQDARCNNKDFTSCLPLLNTERTDGDGELPARAYSSDHLVWRYEGQHL